MEHFVAYHNVEKIGGPFITMRKGQADSFNTHKRYRGETLEGSCLGVVEGSGTPRRYRFVTVGKIRALRPARKRGLPHRIYFDTLSNLKRIDVTDLRWFRRLLKEQQAFRFGLRRIKDGRVVHELENLAPNLASAEAKDKDDPIKALTIRQPWAELILRGRKPFELWTWRTNYRGPLVIHAAAKVDAWDARHFGLDPEKLTTSAFVGFAILLDVRPYTREDARLLKKRRAGHGWFPGNLSWVLKKPRRISPIKGKGQLGLFSVPKSVERRVSRLFWATGSG